MVSSSGGTGLPSLSDPPVLQGAAGSVLMKEEIEEETTAVHAGSPETRTSLAGRVFRPGSVPLPAAPQTKGSPRIEWSEERCSVRRVMQETVEAAEDDPYMSQPATWLNQESHEEGEEKEQNDADAGGENVRKKEIGKPMLAKKGMGKKTGKQAGTVEKEKGGGDDQVEEEVDEDELWERID